MVQKSSGRGGASSPAITVKNLKKSYKNLDVLKGVSFEVKTGTVLALLGPNGAGKTTTVRILSTLLKPDGGMAKVGGYDINEQGDEVRACIGLTGQYAAVDGYLTGRENLYMIGRLYRLSQREASKKADELLERFDLVDASKRAVKTYSGGMRRRLDLAMSLIASPQIIFLDEPTTGLDPRSRMAMWNMIKELVSGGTTVLLTTQYMEEADHLADEIVVIDHGKVIAKGTPSELKSKIGSDRLELKVAKKANFEAAKKLVDSKNALENKENLTLSVATRGGVKALKQTLDEFDKAKIALDSVELRKPTLDDVFLSLTGHGTEAEKDKPTKTAKGAKK